MNLTLSLNKALSLWGDRQAIVDGDRRFTYAEFGTRVDKLARFLSARRLNKGDVVAVIAPNIHEFMEIYYACIMTGLVLAPINYRLAPREISAILQDCGAQLLFAHFDFHKQVLDSIQHSIRIKELVWLRMPGKAELPSPGIDCTNYDSVMLEWLPKQSYPSIQGDDLAHLYYTSGTTGKPKGVMLSHNNVSLHALSAIAEMQLTDADVWAHIAPMFHLADAWATFAITWVGGKHVFVPYFHVNSVIRAFETERITITNLIPTMLTALLNEPGIKEHDYRSLRCLLSGGAPIAPDTVKRILDTFGCDYVQTYGMTETSPYLTLSLLKSHLKELPADCQLKYKCRTGRPFAAVELLVVAEDGSEVDKNDTEVGEIIVRGPTVTAGYWHQEKETEKALRDGWLYTGDLATIDAEGYVNIVDRKKDMIISGGENVYSTEVEYVLYEHPSVHECAVIGQTDETWGEIVKAVVVLKPGKKVSEQELISFVKDRLAHYKAPRVIEFMKELPKTGSGKICKKDLKVKEKVSPSNG